MPDASNVSPAYAGEPTQPCDGFPDCVTFDAHGLVPVVVQQEGTGEVLMVAWANREALDLTVKTRTSWFWSRSRKELWNKGATSGNMQQVRRSPRARVAPAAYCRWWHPCSTAPCASATKTSSCASSR